MARSVIRLGEFVLSDTKNSVSLAVASGVYLLLPTGHKPVTNHRALHALVKSGELWVGRTGACRLHINVLLDGYAIANEASRSFVNNVIFWVEEAELWSRLGLQLIRDCTNVYAPNSASFSITHPDLSSGLVAPPGAPVAAFQEVSISLDFRGVLSCKPKGKRAKKKVTETDAIQNAHHSPELDPGSQRDIDLFLADWRPQNIFEEPVKKSPPFNPSNTSTDRNTPLDLRKPPSKRSSKKRSPPLAESQPSSCSLAVLLASPATQLLLETGLHFLVVGKKTVAGVRTRKAMMSQPLTNLIPAVFDMAYLQAVAQRVRLLPLLNSALVELKNAESPQLRERAKQLAKSDGRTGSLYPQSSSQTVDDEEEAGVSNRLWKLIQTNTKAAKAKSTNVPGSSRISTDLVPIDDTVDWDAIDSQPMESPCQFETIAENMSAEDGYGGVNGSDIIPVENDYCWGFEDDSGAMGRYHFPKEQDEAWHMYNEELVFVDQQDSQEHVTNAMYAPEVHGGRGVDNFQGDIGGTNTKNQAKWAWREEDEDEPMSEWNTYSDAAENLETIWPEASQNIWMED